MGDLCYFGIIEEIWEFNYISFCIPLFKCLWVDSNGGSKIDEMGFTLVNFNRISYKDDCFILANQAKQVFYVEDLANPQWSIVLNYKLKFMIDEDNDTTYKRLFDFINELPMTIYDNSDEDPTYVIKGEDDTELVNKSRKK
ncbi:hypothetical protein AXF42_Ash013287 [Apostasia shenzhenica]|uniref:DUF4216 domain-containing protein n=1 Tax=Apostasia shenzhenica TaxID=1088818 RepID=A0A2I0BBJ7_9ASPA|nr:hypothetical protein AXF42_Ash013287 [Apostasia shenzhenica]